jgi:hypothetical protein
VTLGEMRLIITRNGEREEGALRDEEEYVATLCIPVPKKL